jgi:hypothetical protein
MNRTVCLFAVAALVCAMLTGSGTAQRASAQGIEQVIAVAGPMIAQEAMPQIRDVAAKFPGYIQWLGCGIKGSFHITWHCQYANGLVVTNSFRCYRDCANVTAYFTGQSRGGDCDAVVEGRGENVCYGGSQDMSSAMVANCGPITAIWHD